MGPHMGNWYLKHANHILPCFMDCSSKKHLAAVLTCFSRTALPFNHIKCQPRESLDLVDTVNTLQKAGLHLGLCLLASQAAGKERNSERGLDLICPQVSGMREKKMKEKKASPGWIQTQVYHVSFEIPLLLTQRGRKGNWHSLFCCWACCPFLFFVNSAAQWVGAVTWSSRGCRGSRRKGLFKNA